MIRFVSVTKSFRRQEVLSGVSLEIGRGDRIAMVGSNGAGKTTLIRCLLGEYTHGGVIAVDGLSPRAERRRVLGRVGFVPQIPPPLKMPVGELIGFSARLCGTDPRRIEAVVEDLGLEVARIRRQAFVKLSGGQKQKLLIAIALGREADILIMDEPAANLDPEARHIFFRLLAERQDDAAMLITSHRLDEVAALVNRVIEMDQGRVVLDDRVADAIDLASSLACRITVTRAEPTFARAMAEWGFIERPGSLSWEGRIAGPDRLRFLGMLSRYAALLAGIRMEEVANGRKTAVG